MDNVFIERLWRSLKYECVYLHAFETGIGAAGGTDADGSATTMPPGLIRRSAAMTPDEAYAAIAAGRNEEENWRPA